jgi:hypothetical protein
MIRLISSKVALAFEERLPISFRFSCNKSTVSTSSSEMPEIPESDEIESTGRTAEVVVDVADERHRSDVKDSSHILTFFLSLNFEFEKLGSVNFYFFDTL